MSSQFQKKTWANKLQLRRRLYALTLKEGGSVQEHIKKLAETFEELAVIGSPVEEEDQVVHLLASLPDSYSMLVTALEANAEVPKMEIVTERLLHEERKQKDKDQHGQGGPTKAFVSGKVLKCFHCKKPGHIKRNCCLLAAEIAKSKGNSRSKGSYTKTDKATIGRHIDSESDALVVQQALQAGRGIGSWIVDSGATCHMCSNKELFSELCPVTKKTDVTLGDGRQLEATGQGNVSLTMNLLNGVHKCRLLDVLYVPSLAYNLLSVSKAAEKGKETVFNEKGCEIVSASGTVIAKAQHYGNLYYLDCTSNKQTSSNTETERPVASMLWTSFLKPDCIA